METLFFDFLFPDFSWVKAWLVGIIIALAGIAALMFVPGRWLKLFIGLGLIGLGVAIIQGWVTL